MNHTNHHQTDTLLMDHDHDYELNHILSVASAYLDTGQIDDAEDLLHEALEAGAEHPEVKAFARRLDHARGRPTSASVARIERGAAKPDILMNFTSPLPGVESQPPVVQRLLRDGEGHYAAQRMYSALDSTYVACAESPSFLPGFVRLAEIQLALGKSGPAMDLRDTLSRWYQVHDESPDRLVRSLSVSLDPDNTAALIEHATTLVDDNDPAALEPFVPAAISRALESNSDAARSLSERYLQLRADNVDAQRLHLQVVLSIGDPEDVIEVARQIVQPASALDLLVARAIAESTVESEEWLAWLELVAVGLRADPAAHAAVHARIQQAQRLVPVERFKLMNGVVAFAAGQLHESADSLRRASHDLHPYAVEEFVSRCTLALTLDALNDPLASQALLDALQVAYRNDVEAFAASTNMFGTSASPTELLRAATGRGSGESVAAILALRDANPERLEVRSALAEMYLASGNAHEAVRELRYVAQEYEKSGNLNAMVQAMRHISKAVPNNVEMKAKLIEGYIRRGVLDEAVEELGLLGALYRERNRAADAVAAFTRGAEIASATGAVSRGNELFQQAVEAAPDDVPVRHAAVAFYLQTGSILQATEQLREVVRIALVADDRDEAVAALHQIIALAPQDPEAYHKLGEVLTSLGEYTQAERVYRRLASFSPYDRVLEAKQSALAVLAATK